jgi:integrase
MLYDAAETWRTSRVDVVEGTGDMHRSSLGRIFKVAPSLRRRRIDELTVDDVVDLVAALTAAPYKRETIKKSRDALALTLDFYEVSPNVARDKRVKLPKERKAHVPPPREDRELGAPLFPDLNDAALRTAITRACKTTGTPHFSPHGLRRRRGSLHYKRTGSLAEVA